MSLDGFSGASGIKYGLNIRGIPKKPVVQKPKVPVANAFQADSDDELEGLDEKASANVLIMRQQKQLQDAKKTKELYQKALEEDASVFDYDGVYDDMKKNDKKSAAVAEKVQGKSRYINTLLEKAKERQREQDIIMERRMVKERQKEDHMYGDKEKFVTAAYKKKLEEDAKWLAEEKRREEIEAKNDVTKRSDMSGFYANLLNRNEAFGGKAEPARAAAPVAAAAAAAAAAAEPEQRGGAGEERGRDAHGRSASPPSARMRDSPPPGAARAERGGGGSRGGSPARGAEPPARRDEGAGAGPGPAAGAGAQGGRADAADAAGDAAAAAEEAPKPAAKRERPSEVDVMSAKERYLARKKARAEGGA